MTTIQIGIDLGTTNSAIAINSTWNIEVIKNFERDEFTPSVFWFDKAKNPLVGKRAYEKLYKYADAEDLWNFKSEVKRLMWTAEITFFPRSEKSMKAEEISAEILKYLKSTALKQYPSLNTAGVVITIPAHFSTLESESTKRAWEMAWFQQVVLLQEPIAAAIAYGFSKTKNASWLVYDLWWGTFDTAIIQSKDGLLNILSSKGDNFLWGKDFDWAIVDNIFIPKILQKFELLNFNRGNGKYKDAFNILKGLAENAKKMLTYDEEINVEIDNVWNDDNNKPVYLSISLSRRDFEEIISPFVRKSINLVKETIKESWIQKESIEKVVLVWWSTQSPYISIELERELWVSVDATVDPLTVVAQGAAIYAQTQTISQAHQASNKATLNAYKLDIHHETVTTEKEEMLTGTVYGGEDEELYIQIQSESGYFSSNKILVRNWKFIINLQIETAKVNQFWLYLFDNQGGTLETDIEGFSITHGQSVGSIPIPSSIWVALAMQSSWWLYWSEEMYWYFHKNDKLPLKKTQTFKTFKPLSKNSKNDALPIRIYEGESESPDRNTFVCEVGISGDRIPYDLEAGTPIEVEICIDQSRQLSVNAYIPSIDLKIDARKTTYDERIDVTELEKSIISEVHRYEHLKKNLTPRQKGELDEDIEYIQNAISNAKGDEDEKRKSHKKLKDLKGRLDELSKGNEFDSLVSQFEKLCQTLDDIFSDISSADYRWQDLVNRYKTIKGGGQKSVDSRDQILLAAIVEQLHELQTSIFMQGIVWWKNFYNDLRTGGYTFSSDENANYLFKKWEIAIKNDDKELLEKCVRELIDMLPTDERGKIQWWNLSGITI